MMKYNLIFIFILSIHRGEAVIETLERSVFVKYVDFAKLTPRPYQVDDNIREDKTIFQFNAERRRTKCKDILPDIDDHVISPLEDNYYVPAVHRYEFDDGTTDGASLLAWQCPTFPKIYVSLAGKDDWFVIVEKPQMQMPDFRLEIATKFKEHKNIVKDTPHYFDTLNSVERWNICNEVCKTIRYDLEWRDEYFSEINMEIHKYHSFEYANRDTNEIHRVLRCPTWPILFLRLHESTASRGIDDRPFNRINAPVIVITLVVSPDSASVAYINKKERNFEDSYNP